MTVLGITLSAAVIWLIAAGVLAILEAFTQGLTCIWFAGGAVAAAVAAIFEAPLVLQIIIFLFVSIILLVATRPIARKKLNARVEKTNVDAIPGSEGVVENEIPVRGRGQVRACGKVWTAVCADENKRIEAGKNVIIKDVKGVTLTVEETE